MVWKLCYCDDSQCVQMCTDPEGDLMRLQLRPSAANVIQYSQVPLLLSLKGHDKVLRGNDALSLLVDVTHDDVVQTLRQKHKNGMQ